MEQLPNGSVRYAIKFPQPQAYVEVFVRQNGVQNIAQNIVSSAVANGDGTFTYSLIKPASQYHAGDIIQARFYTYRAGRPGVFTPGPAQTVWLPNLIYGQTTCPVEPPSGCHSYITTLSNGSLRFAVTLPGVQQYVEVFVRQNGIQNVAQNIVGSRVANPDGTSTYSLVRPASQYQAGDIVLTRFYSYKAGQPGVFTPGPQEQIWAPEFIVGSVCQRPVGGPCANNTECQNGLTCVVGTCRDCSTGGCEGTPCTSTTSCVPGLVCAGGTCHTVCDTNPTAPGCVAGHCANGVADGGETDVDCGGACPPCDSGGGCGSNADCEPGSVCGTNNGACFTGPRRKKACWPAQCEDGVSPDECGQETSACGKNCGCVVPCVEGDPATPCPTGEVCKRLGGLYGSSSPDVCVADPQCPSNDPNLCGGTRDLCGDCLCTPDCSDATCQDPSDGCGGHCPGVCQDGETGCGHDLHCPASSSCMLNTDGTTVCRPTIECGFRHLVPPLCGTPGAPCGDECPACTPQCSGRQCGLDPNCGTSCGTCPGGTFCDVQGQCAPSTPSDPPVLVPDGAGGERELDDLPPAATNPVGALKGSFSVSEQGTSEYSVPIEVPPGRAGVEPALTLKYAGSRANGDLGMGWRLEGLSTITRCPRIYALDGYSAPIKNDPTDRFCIDGKRLESVIGSYGANQAEYRTLIDSFAKVVSYSEGDGHQHDEVPGIPRVARDLQGPDFFKVWTKDGRILTYGRARDALVFGRNGVRHSWLLERVEDRSGNTMLVSYDNVIASVPSLMGDRGGSIARPLAIAYTGHGEQAGDREVRFEYEGRGDPQVKFLQGGLPMGTFGRLSRIKTLIKGAPVKNYRLEYGPTVFSQIDKIFECAGGDDTICKRPTLFDYVQESGFTSGQNLFPTEEGGQLDLNGDGVPDFYETEFTVGSVKADPKLTAAAIGAHVVVGVATSFASAGVGLAINVVWAFSGNDIFGDLAEDPKVTFKDKLYLGTRSRLEFGTQVTNIQGVPCFGTAPTFFLDYDQDGKDDVMRDCGSGFIQVGRSLGDGQFTPQGGGAPVAQFLVLGLRILDHSVSGSHTEPGPSVIVYDVNGDSLQDLVSCKDQYQLEVRLRISPSQGFATTPITKLYPQPPAGTTDEDVQKGQTLCGERRPTHTIFDIDGDGAPELLVRDKDGWKVLRYAVAETGPAIDWAEVELPDTGMSASGANLALSDMNGDGLTDMTAVSGQSATFWINTGAGRFLSRHLNHPTPARDFDPGFRLVKATTIDYDADGRLDFVENWRVSDVGQQFNVALLPNSLATQLTAQRALDLRFPFPPSGALADARFNKVSDLDGDGNQDLFGQGSIVFYGSGARNALLSRVEDGLGKLTTVTYDGLGTYEHTCPGDNFPETCIRRLNGLVALQRDGFVVDGEGTEVIERTLEYKNLNARMNVSGHGWLGFERRTVIDHDSGRAITTDYEPPQRYTPQGQPTETTSFPYLYPFAGLVRRTLIDSPPELTSEGSPLEGARYARRVRVDNRWVVGTSDQNRPFPSLSLRTRAEFEREMPTIVPPPLEIDGTLRLRCRDAFEADRYGNTTVQEETCQRGGDDEPRERTRTETVFLADPGAWLISNPEFVTIQSRRNSQVDQTQEWDPAYDGFGRLTSVTRNPTGQWHQTLYVLDEYGNVEQVVETVASGELPRNSSIDYDPDNIFPAVVRNALGHETQITFDKRWGEPATVVDPNGIAVQNAYDGWGLLALSQDPTGTTNYAFSYAPVGAILSEVGDLHPRLRISMERQGADGSSGGSSAQELDYLGRLIRSETTGLLGTSVLSEQAYDPRGRMKGVTEPHTADAAVIPWTRFSYDHLDRVTLVTRSDDSTIQRQYGSAATLAAEHAHLVNDVDCWSPTVTQCAVDVELSVDEEGHRAAVIKDHLGMVLRSIDGDNITTTTKSSNYKYGPFNRLTSATNNRGVGPSFSYDAYGRLLTFNDPDVGPFSQTYNAFDELKTRTDLNSQVRTYNYDRLGRISTVDDFAGRTQWTYDQGTSALGRISETVSPPTTESPNGQRVRYTYQPPSPSAHRGLLSRLEYEIDGANYPLHYTYDAHGRSHEVTYPNLGGGTPIVTRSSYDVASGALTRVDEVGGASARLLWRLDSAFQGHLIATETFGNGAASNYTYSADRRFLDTVHTTLGASTIQSIDYEHYLNGQVLERTSANVAHEYTYDQLTRLSSVTTTRPGFPTGTASYTYDDGGNLTQRGGRTIEHWLMQPHLVKAVGSTTYHHDANGNLIRRTGPDAPGGNQTLQYTPFDLPHTIVTGTGTGAKTTRFDYTADESRVVRRDPDKTRHFATDLYQRVLAPGGATLEERFRLYAGSRAIAEIVRTPTGDKTLFFHTDHLGSVDVLSDSAGSSFQQEYDPWGSPFDLGVTDETRAGFTGHQHDQDLGLIDMNGRIYDTLSARFTTPDPVMQAPYFSQGLNRYAYVFNDPVNMTDPSGFYGQQEGAALGFAIGNPVTMGLAANAVAAISVGTMSGVSAAGGVLGAAFNIGMATFNPPGAGTPTVNGNLPAPSGAPRFNATGGQTPNNAVGNTQGGVGPAPARIQGAESGATFIDKQPDRLRFLVDKRGWYPYQRLPEEMAKRLQPLFSRFGIDVRRDIWVTVRPIPGGAGEYVHGNMIRISDRAAEFTDQRNVAGVAAHEIVHLIQHRIMGDAGASTLQWFEQQSWGDSRYGMKPGLNVPINQVNPVSGNYALEGLADRFADEVFSGAPW